MHLLATSSTALDDLVEAIDLGQRPGHMLILSYADTDLSGIASAWEISRHELPSVRLANLRDECKYQHALKGESGEAP